VRLLQLRSVAGRCQTDLAFDGRHHFVRKVAKVMPSQESRFSRVSFVKLYETIDFESFDSP